MTKANFLNPETLPPPPGYSQLVEVGPGRLVFIAGQIAFDSDGKLVGDADFASQAEQVFRNLIAAVESCGGGVENIIKLTMFVTDMSNRLALKTVRDRFIVPGPNVPASTLVEVSALFLPELLFEAEAVAWLAA